MTRRVKTAGKALHPHFGYHPTSGERSLAFEHRSTAVKTVLKTGHRPFFSIPVRRETKNWGEVVPLERNSSAIKNGSVR